MNFVLNHKHNLRSTFAGAFTLVELLVVLAIVGLLTSLLLPALARAKSKTHSTSCLNNLKQLQLAWHFYVHDNNDSFPPNISRKIGFEQFNVTVDGRAPWVLGNAKLDTNNTNIEAGVLFPYAGSAAIYRCPADKSTARDQPSLRRVRSYAMLGYFNVDVKSDSLLDITNDSEQNLKKLPQLVNPGPNQTFVFIDEHEASIDDGIFGTSGSVDPFDWTGWIWGSFPGDRHDNGANLSFADGHAEFHPWRAHRVITSYAAGMTHINSDDILNLQDAYWVYQRLPRPH